jgi:phosphoribosyl-ATP pyrophosphohydrolase/phosphoribosyl-AMP cyclohydrolase/histidinol dehydrogenase
VYRSRRRGSWTKGATSGATQELLRIDLDCDRDALRFVVRQRDPGFCHAGLRTCFGPAAGLEALEATLRARLASPPAGSYVARLAHDPELLASKLREEAGELARAVSRAEVVHEAADVLFFALARVVTSGACLADVERELDRRALHVSRRPGAAKDQSGGGA